MKILYGIQGTGNGHISRALEILPVLQTRGEVDVLISGRQSELSLPYPVKYNLNGLGFVFGKSGGIDLVETYRKSRLKLFYKEVKSLPVEEYDVVISDFEPVTAWAGMRRKLPVIGLSNQVSLLSPNVPKAKSEDFVGKFIIRNYAPCAINLGFSYQNYNNGIYTPVIRKSLRDRELSNNGHVTVYLPSYSDEKILKVLREAPGVEWQVFSKRATEANTDGNVRLLPLDQKAFEKSVASAMGIVTAAGFGTTTEALYMGKKLLVIPQKMQYEQACNAQALKEMGVTVIKSLKLKHIERIRSWVDSADSIQIDYPDHTERLVDELLFLSLLQSDHYTDYLERGQYALHQA